MMDKRRRTSVIWKHFTLTATNKSKASHSIYDCVVPRGGSSVKGYIMSNLWQHLETKHPVEYKAVKVEKEIGKGGKRQLSY